jgi:hypothetical protein
LCRIAGVVYMGLRCCIVVGLFHSISSSLADGFDSFGSLMLVDALRVSRCLQGYTCVQYPVVYRDILVCRGVVLFSGGIS